VVIVIIAILMALLLPAVQALIDSLDDPVSRVRRASAQSLGGKLGLLRKRLCCGDALFFTGILSNDCRGIADNIRCAELPHGADLVATIDEALAIGLKHHQSGNLERAEQIYRPILQISRKILTHCICSG